MFGKNGKCPHCQEKINDKYNYCPYCRNSLKDSANEEDWGLLGKNDFIDPKEIRMPAGLNTLFNSLVKSLSSQMKELDKNNEPKQKSSKKSKGISISISSFGNGSPEIKISSFGDMPKLKQKSQDGEKEKKIKLPIFSDSGKFAGLPKQEPETNVRRLSNKVVYEVKLPGVKTTKDLSIVQLENSVEIKAIAGKKVFYKVIPISLPINKYDLSQGILTLELDSKE